MAFAALETGAPMAKALGNNHVVILKGHGAVTASTEGPEDAIQRLINLEQLARITWMAFSAVGRDYEKYGFSENIIAESRRLSAQMRDRFDTPGKDLTKDQCYYNAAMVKTFREAVEG